MTKVFLNHLDLILYQMTFHFSACVSVYIYSVSVYCHGGNQKRKEQQNLFKAIRTDPETETCNLGGKKCICGLLPLPDYRSLLFLGEGLIVC